MELELALSWVQCKKPMLTELVANIWSQFEQLSNSGHGRIEWQRPAPKQPDGRAALLFIEGLQGSTNHICTYVTHRPRPVAVRG